MSKTWLMAACMLILAGIAGQGAGLGPIALGFHLIPSLEARDGHRVWDLSVSLGVTVVLSDKDSLELLAIIDSGPTALGTTVTYQNELTGHISLGAGATALWPISDQAELRTPLFESFARVAAHGDIGAGVSVEAAASLPFLTVAKRTDRWALFPLAELPSLALAGDIRLNEEGALKLQLTVQPVIVDTTTLVAPVGRVTDDLLILPMFSAFTRYTP